ncbi:Glycosyltransferase involved in cell wall bisynthesis [Roseomonas rosea]|uniref:Glycosyltransferase involved in cell wall bisynthesis n=1 Tax=Muricoccus roseus TaxID=198092 RepID=A0A1M6C670_9PROT|nr:glycosyltransferase family 4 protein [Roseomonas rosea]SHI56234.1 Glycosyltransferase involved in cell wall bisynthesis [Roseomonas rosea]
MRILLWYWGRRGGGAQFTLCLARGLAGCPGVTLGLSMADRNSLLPELRAIGVPLDAVPTFGGIGGAALGLARLPALRRRLVEQARLLRADVVISAMNHVWTPLVAGALPRAGIPFVSTVHDALPHPGDPAFAWAWRLRRELNAASGAVTFSHAVAEAVAARRPGMPILRLPLGAHIPGQPLTPTAEPTTDFLFFGRLRAYKGLDILRDAFAALRAQHPGVTLRVVGEGDAEACAPGLSALPGVTLEARWVPDQEMPALVAAARAVVLPYREASQSGVLPIALALGVPVIATPIGGLSAQLEHGVSGLVARDVSAPALAESMEMMLDAGRRAALSAGARRAGASLADWDAQAGTLVDWLRGLKVGDQ